MKTSCLLLIKQGWLGLPLFFIGLVSLAFSQFDNQLSEQTLSSDQLLEEITNLVSKNEAVLNNLIGVGRYLEEKQKLFNSTIEDSENSNSLPESEISEFSKRFNTAASRLTERMDSTNETFSLSQLRLQDAKEIFADLTQSFAGNLDEAQSPLLALRENLLKTDVEINALSKMVDGVIEDFGFEADSILEQIRQSSTPSPSFAKSSNIVRTENPNPANKVAQSPPQPTSAIGRKIASVIKADQPIVYSSSKFDKFAQERRTTPVQETLASDLETSTPLDSDAVLRLQKELALSRNIQSELSIDSSSLKADLRKAYREIVALQNNLTESQALINELEETRQSFYKNDDGSRATAQMVSNRIKRLETDLADAKNELSQARQSLLLEQQRSNAMIASITTELERTRKELDYARQAVRGNGVSFDQLATLEQELAKTKQALRSAQNQAVDPTSSDYVKLQDELRKSLSEIANMQIEMADMNSLEKELEDLKETLAQSDGTSSGETSRVSAKYVKKLLADLGEAKEEVVRLKEGSSNERGNLSTTVAELEKKLQKTKMELDSTRQDIEANKETLAKREFDFANTIKILEEEAEIAQAVLQQAADGKISAVPFISEMEDDLAASESRIRLLSDQFSKEQKKATDVIDGLQQEIELASARQKKSLDQLERRELELTGQEKEIETLNRRKKELEEELQVVKVIAGQLQDLNQVLEETKEAQSSQSHTSDQVVDSLREELNKAKVELVVTLEEKEKVQKDFSDKIFSLERQLDDSRNEMIEEQELFYESSEESKILIQDLRNELKIAKNQVAKMKSSGFTESVETKQAVSQLQEALGTIRILKESLEDAEETNLELDNLRAELADSMSVHLKELENTEDEKLALSQKIYDLEAEIDVLRDHSASTGVAHLSNNAKLTNKVDSSLSQNELLSQRLADTESIGIASLVDLEDEIAELRGVNEELRDELSSISRTNEEEKINDLESELAQAKWKLESLSDDEFRDLNSENIKLKQQLSELRTNIDDQPNSLDSPNQINESNNVILQASLDQALARVEELEAQIMENGDKGSQKLISDLENNLLSAEQTIENLQSEMEDKSVSHNNLLSKLDNAFSRIQILESQKQPTTSTSSSDWQKMKNELDQSKIKILELGEEIALLSQMNEGFPGDDLVKSDDILLMQGEINSLREELALSNEMLENLPSEDELLAMQMEIESLRQELSLKDLMGEQDNVVAETNDNAELEKQLKSAVSESFDLQMELERALDRLAELESSSKGRADSAPSTLSEQDKQARINQLTLALKNSEQLREETENLVVELEKRVTEDEGIDFSNNPEFIALQQEMVALQNELLLLQDFEDPQVIELTETLDRNVANSEKLESELRRAKTELENLTVRAGSLNQENSRLRELASNRDSSPSNSSISLLKATITNLETENSSLLAQLAEKEKRLSGLRQDLDSNLPAGNDQLLLVQIDDLRSKLRQSKGMEDRYKSENRLIREELNQVRLNLQNSKNTADSDGSSIAFELDRVRAENESLKDRLSNAQNLPDRDRFQEQIRELSQSSMNAQVMLDQERAVVDELKRQLSDAREIKREVLERGKSSRLKLDLLDGELSDARLRIDSLEKALVAARNAIRVLQDGGSVSTMIPVSTPLNSSVSSPTSRYRGSNFSRSSVNRLPSPSSRFSRPSSTLYIPGTKVLPAIKNTSGGSANLKMSANVKFLDNKVRPAAFTEFFVVEDDLQTILSAENMTLPRTDGIQSYAEYWARSVQRGYKFPGAAAKIRNALARASLRRIKTNSLGEGNISNLPSGRYHVVGTSPLGQVGVVWSKVIVLNDGDNLIGLNLADAAWAQ